MSSQRITTVRLDREVLAMLDRMAERLRTERSSLLRRAVDRGARILLVEDSIARYNNGELSSGAAAEHAGISLVDFFGELRARDLPILADNEGLEEELAAMKKRMGRRDGRRR